VSVLSLPAAKLHLNITTDTNDVEIQSTIDAAEAAIGRKVGPLETTTITSRVSGCAGALVLPTLPVVSVTTVTGSDASTITAGDLVADPSGVVAYAARGSFTAVAYTVVYEAGWGTVAEDVWTGPADLLQAIKEMTRHLWVTQRGGSTRPGSTPPDALSNTLPGSAFALPIRVQQLVEPYIPLGGL
jgi:hypothetical protein